MHDTLVVVEGFVPAAHAEPDDLSSFGLAMSFALDQRAFGPRRLLVAFADADGRMRGIAHTKRTDPIELALRGCLQYMGDGAAAVVAFNDEPVAWGEPPPELADRFWVWHAMCASAGVHLVDWICCDDQLFRSTKIALQPDTDWWDVP
jgi:hypothetical protein